MLLCPHSQQEYWKWLPFLLRGSSHPGMNPDALAAGKLTTWKPEEAPRNTMALAKRSVHYVLKTQILYAFYQIFCWKSSFDFCFHLLQN